MKIAIIDYFGNRNMINTDFPSINLISYGKRHSFSIARRHTVTGFRSLDDENNNKI